MKPLTVYVQFWCGWTIWPVWVSIWERGWKINLPFMQVFYLRASDYR